MTMKGFERRGRTSLAYDCRRRRRFTRPHAAQRQPNNRVLVVVQHYFLRQYQGTAAGEQK